MIERQPPVERSPGIFEIDLGCGRVALVDAADMPLVMDRAWRAQKGKAGTYYAASNRGVLMHRVIMGNPRGVHVDHVNCDGLDNRRSNLRTCSNAQNTQNQRKRKNTSSRFKGVSRTNVGTWVAQIEKNGRTVKLGHYTDEVIAAKQYDRAARLMFGRFARTNEMLGLLEALRTAA